MCFDLIDWLIHRFLDYGYLQCIPILSFLAFLFYTVTVSEEKSLIVDVKQRSNFRTLNYMFKLEFGIIVSCNLRYSVPTYTIAPEVAT